MDGITQWTRWCALVGAVALGGCDDDGYGDGAPAEQEQDPGDPAELSFAADVEPILLASCSCHTGSNPAAGLDLSEGNSFDALVQAPAAGADLDYVAPGDPQSSYLLHKLDGTQADVGGAGARMPMGGELAEDHVITIEDWIDAGAKP
jgi:hypothetical protein